MSDWSIVEDTTTKGRPTSTKLQSDWSIIEPEPSSRQIQANESLGEATIKAPFRIGEDIYRGGANLIKNSPQYYQSAKSGIGALINPENPNPRNELKQLIAGLGEQGQNVFNTPHDIINYATNRLNLIPQHFNEKIQMARMPNDTSEIINQTLGKPQNKAEEALRFGARNSIGLAAPVKAASIVNPMKFTHNNLVKNVLDTRKQMIEKYSGPKGEYTKLFDKAKKQGYGDVKFDPNKINLKEIKEYANPKYYESLEEFMKTPSVNLAQKAQSDLNKYISSMKKRTLMTSPEQASLRAAKEAQQNIKENMFKGSSQLKKQYNKITQGYKNEVIPYTTNKDINAFLDKKLLPKELTNKLAKGNFAVTRGKHHPRIAFKNFLNEHPYIAAGLSGGGAFALYNELMGNKIPEQ